MRRMAGESDGWAVWFMDTALCLRYRIVPAVQRCAPLLASLQEMIMTRCTTLFTIGLTVLFAFVASAAEAQQPSGYKNADFDLTAASVVHDRDLDLLVFEQQVAGTAG